MEKKTDSVEKRILDSVVDGRIPCPVLRAIAEEEGIAYNEAGRIANKLKVKISDCELGCF